MKKILYVTATVAVCLFCCTFFCACDSDDGVDKIAAPVNISVSAREILSWDDVDGASGYTVRVDGEEFEVDTAELDLFYLRHGTHEISIMTRSDTLAGSDWSETFTYDLPYPQGITTYSDDNGLSYKIKVANSTVVKGKIIIPDTYNDRKISMVDLKGCNKITSIVLPNTVEAFSLADCTALQRIKISESVTCMGNGGTSYGILSGCSSLTEIDLPANIERVAANAFAGTSISKIHFPASVKAIDPSSLYDTDELTEITVDEDNPEYKSEGNCIIKSEDNAVVRGCKTSVIPDHCTVIQNNAFKKVKDIDIRIPASVTQIGSYEDNRNAYNVFDNNVRSISIDDNNPILKCDGNCIIDKNSNTVLYVFDNYDIPRYCTAIGTFAFGNNGDEEIVIPDNIEEIRQSAFSGRSNLKSVRMGSGVKTIGSRAFGDCENLNFIDFGNVVTIGSSAFDYCGVIETVIFRSSLKRIEADAFNQSSITAVIPRSVEFVGRRALGQSVVFVPYDSLQDANADRVIFTSGAFGDSTVFYGCDYAESDQSGVYLTSVKDLSDRDADENRPNQVSAANRSISLPVRYGYEFAGWSVEQGGSEVRFGVFDHTGSNGVTVKRTYIYDATYHHLVLDGSVLYAVWTPVN